jgi:Asp-tRNA(Asn)/Glu-tRNA(Gln) amidotransferase A subunit family amidase
MIGRRTVARSLVVAAIVASASGLRAEAGLAGTPADPTSYTIAQAQAALAQGQITSVALTNAYLARITTYEPFYNAFTNMNPDALKEAGAVDAARAAGKPLGPLAGVPIVVKDSVDIAGLPTTAGWKGFSAASGGVDLIPARDAPLVARLRAAGAVILGKTNLPVFANSGANANDSWAGPTYNALDRGWAPGGSSTGTATSVAAGFAAAGIAEETGGSIQNPAAAQSLVGVKTTFGLVPTTGLVPLAGPTRDVVGPLAKTVQDAATMLDVLAGYTPQDAKTKAARGKVPAGGYAAGLSAASLKGARVGLYGPGWRKDGTLSAPTKKLYDARVKTLVARGATTVRDPFRGSGFAGLAKAEGGYDPRGSESLPHDLNAYLKGLGPQAAVHSLAQLVEKVKIDPFGKDQTLAYYASLPGFKESLEHPDAPVDLSSFERVKARYLRVFNRVMTRRHLDVLVYPQGTAEIGKLYGGDVSSTTVSEINIAGLPAVIVPAGAYADGKPFSLVFVGRQWSEAKLLSYAYDYEQAAPGRVVPTTLATTPGPKAPAS